MKRCASWTFVLLQPQMFLRGFSIFILKTFLKKKYKNFPLTLHDSWRGNSWKHCCRPGCEAGVSHHHVYSVEALRWACKRWDRVRSKQRHIHPLPLTRFGQSRSFKWRVSHHAHLFTANTEYLIREVRVAKRRGQRLVWFDVGAENRTLDLLHERFHESIHSVVKLMISKRLKNKSVKHVQKDVRDMLPCQTPYLVK